MRHILQVRTIPKHAAGIFFTSLFILLKLGRAVMAFRSLVNEISPGNADREFLFLSPTINKQARKKKEKENSHK